MRNLKFNKKTKNYNLQQIQNQGQQMPQKPLHQMPFQIQNQVPQSSQNENKQVDGVRWEAYDPKIHGVEMSKAPQNKNKDILKEIIQNEKNSQKYYKKLIEKLPSDENKKTLEVIVENSNKRYNKVKEQYKKMFKEEFEGEEKNINVNYLSKKSIEYAVREEYKGLQEIIKYYENTNDFAKSKEIMGIINNKMLDIHLLNIINNKII